MATKSKRQQIGNGGPKFIGNLVGSAGMTIPFAHLIDETLIQTIDDDLVINANAIRALIPLMSQGTLERDQLHTILTVLDDATVENRLALHELLSKANLSDSVSVMHCLKKLLQSLRRFPMDKFSIYSCLGAIGRNHAAMVQAHVAELLDIHPIFDTPEQNIDDDFYLAKLILVLNAASQHSVICSLIPKYIRKHYRYLLRAWPSLISKIPEFEEKEKFIFGKPLIELATVIDSNDKNQFWLGGDTIAAERSSDIKTIWILEPNREFQNSETVRFVAGLPSGIFVRAILENVKDDELTRLRFQVEYPDQTIDYFRPRKQHFVRLNPSRVHLQTSVIVSAQCWAIPASVVFTAGICSNEFVQTSVKSGKDMKNFVPLKNVENILKDNRISVNIHPQLRA